MDDKLAQRLLDALVREVAARAGTVNDEKFRTTLSELLSEADWFTDMVREYAKERVDEMDFSNVIDGEVESWMRNNFSLDNYEDDIAKIAGNVVEREMEHYDPSDLIDSALDDYDLTGKVEEIVEDMDLSGQIEPVVEEQVRDQMKEVRAVKAFLDAIKSLADKADEEGAQS